MNEYRIFSTTVRIRAVGFLFFRYLSHREKRLISIVVGVLHEGTQSKIIINRIKPNASSYDYRILTRRMLNLSETALS